MSVGQNRPSESNQDDPKMSDPSTSPHLSADIPPDSSEEEPQAGPSSLLLALVQGVFKLGGVVLLVYLTYFFTVSFANRTPPPAPLSDEQVKLAKKAEELRNQGKTLLSSYGWVNPATKSNVHIPIERAMELMVAEAAVPPATAVAAAPLAPASRAGTTGTTAAAKPGSPAAGAAPAPAVAVAAPAPAGMPPEDIYRAVCMACHEADGKGKIFRLVTPTIPDLTDPKWQASRTDAELEHSILEGKESTIKGVKSTVMVSQKENLSRARTSVKDMVAFMRAFKGGKQVVSATPGGTSAAAPVQVAQGAAPAVPVISAVPLPSSPPASADATPPHTASTPAATTGLASTKPISTSPPVVAAMTPPGTPNPPPAAGAVSALPSALPVSTANMAAQAERLQAAGATFNTLCIACHGPDGRGTAVRAAMPLLPNFTSHDWHTTKSNGQLATTIMEGKGLMPAWNTQLTAERARDLVLFVRSFGAPELMAETPSSSSPSTAEFDKEMQSLRQKFDDIEKQLQALATPSPRP